MALDKQRILNELGSVVNQLQSADCGCMGNIFSDPNQSSGNMSSAMANYSGYGNGYCHGHGHHHGCHGHTAPCAGEPYSMNNNMNASSMGFCNPPKLYSETYNYLNHNLMQPVVKEVYDDLKSINSTNTVMNNPMAGQMGISSQGNKTVPGMPGNMGNDMSNVMAPNQLSGSAMGNVSQSGNVPTSNMGNMEMNMPMSTGGQQAMQQNLMGMGPQIMNMMKGDGSAKHMGMPNLGQSGSVNSQHGQAGNTPMNMTSNAVNSGYYNTGSNSDDQGLQYNSSYPGSMGMSTMGQSNQPLQNMYGNNIPKVANTESMYHNANPTSAQMGNAYGNQGQQQMVPSSHQNTQGRYGQHGPGIAKFNEMFPGVMQGGDLGFDPMAIAIQMNPANIKQAAMQSMQDMMMKNKSGINKVLDVTANAGLTQDGNIGAANITQSGQPQTNQLQQSRQNSPGYNSTAQMVTNVGATPVPSHHTIAGAAPPQQNQVPQQQQHVYTALTGSSTMRQHDANAVEAQPLPTVYEGTSEYNTYNSMQAPISGTSHTQQLIKEPIFPAETTNKCYEYNTLGQPVEMLPASVYHSPMPDLPQTLAPQPVPASRNDTMKYSNVKSTVSKTSLMGNKSVGRVPSRNQLQHIYNQYKGSQSFTQQNIKANERFSHSEGNLNVVQSNPPRQAPIEKVAGDTIQANQIPTKFENVMDKSGNIPNNTVVGRMGDAPANYKSSDLTKEGQPTGNHRNGLQDMKFTSYPTSTAWSFHGNNQAPFSTGYQCRYR